MILTGKAKKDFENYVLNKELNHDSEVLISVYNQETLFINYNNVKETLLNALIIEWFDDIGIWSNVVNDTLIFDRYYFKKCSWQSNINLLLITANEIYNSK